MRTALLSVKERATLIWALKLGALMTAALMPVVLLALFAIRVESRAIRGLVHANNQAAAAITAELVRRDLERSINLGIVFARLPALVAGMTRQDEAAVRAQLQPVVESNGDIDRAFVTDPTGQLWSDFPRAPESLGRSFAHRDWYAGLSRQWEPYVSEVYQRHAEPRPLVVAVAVEVRAGEQRLGALVYQHRLDRIAAWLREINVGEGGHVFVLDHTGTVSAHPSLDLRAQLHRQYQRLPAVQQAQSGQPATVEYNDPVNGAVMIASFLPVAVGGQRWVVVAQQPVAIAYAPVRQLRNQLIAAAVVLALAAAAVVFGLRRSSERNRRLSEQLAARNRELQAASEQLTRSNDDLGMFAYAASHDLQEPLRAVAGFVQLLEKRYQPVLDERGRQYIAMSVEATHRMQALIHGLLDYSRVTTRGKPLQPTATGNALDVALSNLHVAVAESQATVTRDTLPTVAADELQLTQLFQNLIGNALKFRGAAPPQIHVGAQRQNSHWEFSVRDNGIGIAPEYAERVFVIFQRLHTRQEYPGTGLGLALCKKIVERHGGRIWVESQPGAGATFRFTIPDGDQQHANNHQDRPAD